MGINRQVAGLIGGAFGAVLAFTQFGADINSANSGAWLFFVLIGAIGGLVLHRLWPKA